MTALVPALLASVARHLHSDEPIVTFPASGAGAWDRWDRFLAIRDARVFEIGNICGTCEFWFRRLETAGGPIELEAIRGRLNEGLAKIDRDVVDAFASILQTGTYRIALLRLQPEIVAVASAEDYFASDQPAEWRDRNESPHDPGVTYYRVDNRFGVAAPSKGDKVYEFLVPLEPAAELDSDRIAFFERKLSEGGTPTAVAAGVLDIKGYWDSPHSHWCVGHYLLDGHHKVEAAARIGRPITLLSFIASEQGISSPEQIDQLLAGHALDVVEG